jgi:hypothetical protein
MPKYTEHNFTFISITGQLNKTEESVVGTVTKTWTEKKWVKILAGTKKFSLLQKSKFILRGPIQPPS